MLKTQGVVHFTIPVKDLDRAEKFYTEVTEYDRAKAFLAERGIRIFKEENRGTGTFQGRSAYFHDPDRTGARPRGRGGSVAAASQAWLRCQA